MNTICLCKTTALAHPGNADIIKAHTSTSVIFDTNVFEKHHLRHSVWSHECSRQYWFVWDECLLDPADCLFGWLRLQTATPMLPSVCFCFCPCHSNTGSAHVWLGLSPATNCSLFVLLQAVWKTEGSFYYIQDTLLFVLWVWNWVCCSGLNIKCIDYIMIQCKCA